MDPDAAKPVSPRAGAVAAEPAATPAPAYDKLLRRRARPLSARLFLGVADWIHAERKKTRLTQKQVALHHRIPVRQVITYEAVAKWPREAKTFVHANPDHFRVSDLTRLFANRSWKSKETLLNALRRHVAGKPPRKRAGRGATAARDKSPDILALEDRLRAKLQTRVEVRSETGTSGELRIAFFSLDELDRLLDLIGGNA